MQVVAFFPAPVRIEDMPDGLGHIPVHRVRILFHFGVVPASRLPLLLPVKMFLLFSSFYFSCCVCFNNTKLIYLFDEAKRKWFNPDLN